MNFNYAVFSSITVANRVRKRFEGDRDFICLLHTPFSIATSGCSYSLKFKQSKLPQIVDVCEEMDISIKGIYREIEENTFEAISH